MMTDRSHYSLLASGIYSAKCLFPTKLRQLLDDAEREGNQSIVSWLPHGKAFRVHKPNEFASKIVGRYFNHAQYRSFTRQLCHYGFGKIDFGADTGGFYHPYFLRDQPALAFFIGRKKDGATCKRGTDRKTDRIEEGSREQGLGLSDNSSNLGANFAPLRAFQMIESSFEALNAKPSTNDMYDGINKLNLDSWGALQSSPLQNQPAYVHLRVDERAKISNRTLPELELLGFGHGVLRGGGIDGQIRGRTFQCISSVPMQPVKEEPNHQPQEDFGAYSEARLKAQEDAGSWFSSIFSFFESQFFDDKTSSEDLEPRTIEEMLLLPRNHFSGI